MIKQPRYPLKAADSPTLQALVRNLSDALPHGGEPDAERLASALNQAVGADDWLPPERRHANHERYVRHLIYADPRGQFSVLAIVWAPGQSSPVHNHRTWCGIAIYQGSLTETIFEKPRGKAAPVAAKREIRNKGSTIIDSTGLAIHQYSNHGRVNAISLHVYGVGGNQVSTGINRIFNSNQA